MKPSQRQYEVLMLRAMKMKYTEIEKHLSISQSVLKKHLLQLMVKLNCFSQSELVHFAKSNGWIISITHPGGEVEHRIKPYKEIQALRIFKNI